MLVCSLWRSVTHTILMHQLLYSTSELCSELCFVLYMWGGKWRPRLFKVTPTPRISRSSVSVAWCTWCKSHRQTLNPWISCTKVKMSQSVVLTNTNGSKLRGNQRTGAELVIGRNWRSVEEAVGPSRLERSRSSGCRRRGAGAHGRLTRTTETVTVPPWTLPEHPSPSSCVCDRVPGQWRGPEEESMLVWAVHTQSGPWCRCLWRWCTRRCHLEVGWACRWADPLCRRNELTRSKHLS